MGHMSIVAPIVGRVENYIYVMPPPSAQIKILSADDNSNLVDSKTSVYRLYALTNQLARKIFVLYSNYESFITEVCAFGQGIYLRLAHLAATSVIGYA